MAAIAARKAFAKPQASPGFALSDSPDGLHCALTGDWTISTAHDTEAAALDLQTAVTGARHLALDFSGIGRMDTAGAWLIDRTCQALAAGGVACTRAGAGEARETLLQEARFRTFPPTTRKREPLVFHFLAEMGAGVVAAWRDLSGGIAFLGRVVAAMLQLVASPGRFRLTSLIFHVESFGFRSVPIIALINFLVGGIVAQQGIFQLNRFGASTFAVDLIGILVLRELAVLLTSIMLAGRSGSAITAEIGSMKMREEIDALSVMGLDAVEVLIVPRILALLIALPLLTFIADISAIFGGLLVAWVYAGIGPEVYLSRLQDAISMHTFLSGLIKAPFMALVIGLIASIEGLAVKGSAESLGRQVTSSVVKSIFMVIVIDGLFAMFFAAIRY